MKLSQKKNCRNCRAYFTDRCYLGYNKFNKSFDEYGFTIYGVPQEPCLKPLTNKQLIEALNYEK